MKIRKLSLDYSGVVTTIWIISFSLGCLFANSVDISLSVVSDPSFFHLLCVNLLPLFISIFSLRYHICPIIFLIIGSKAFLFGFCHSALYVISSGYYLFGMSLLFSQCCCDVLLLWLCYTSRHINRCTFRRRVLQVIISCFLISLVDYWIFK